MIRVVAQVRSDPISRLQIDCRSLLYGPAGRNKMEIDEKVICVNIVRH